MELSIIKAISGVFLSLSLPPSSLLMNPFALSRPCSASFFACSFPKRLTYIFAKLRSLH